MNDFFEKIGKTISETGKEVSKKTKQVSDIAKHNSRISSAESSIKNSYKILGKYYYENFKDAPADEVLETVNGITASLESIAEMKEMLFKIKGLVKCNNCGSEEPIEHDYCSKCGTKLEKPEPIVEFDDDDDTDDECFDEELTDDKTADVDNSDCSDVNDEAESTQDIDE